MNTYNFSSIIPVSLLFIFLSILAFTFDSCKKKSDASDYNALTESREGRIQLPEKGAFDTIVNGKNIELYHLENDHNIKIAITNYGARIVSWLTPDKEGQLADIVLGYDNIEAYLNDNMYLGCIVGRYANRIAEGKFQMDGNEYHLAINNAPNTLHGGITGFDKVVWEGIQNGNKVVMKYVSPDMEEGYPGELEVSVTYELTNDNDLLVEYEAVSNRKTIVNLTNHSYFNLTGDGSKSILDHELFINARAITPVDSTLIPDGTLLNVADSPFDFFTNPAKIGQRISDNHHQLLNGMGYDHNWVLNSGPEEITLAARIREPQSNRKIEIYTSAPGIQFYSGNFMDGSVVGKRDKRYNYRCAFALEPQLFPDSPNQPSFPTAYIGAGEKYVHKCIYRIINP